MGKSYLVNGAELCCIHGSKSGILSPTALDYNLGLKTKARATDW